MKFVVTYILTFFYCCTVSSQDTSRYGNFPPPSVLKKINVLKVKNHIKIDGTLNEADWNNAMPITQFVQIEPSQGHLPKLKTNAKILFDHENLYIGAVCYDSTGKKGVRVQDFRRDFDYFENDQFSICLDPFNTRRNTAAFHTNPYSALKDMQVFDDNIYDVEWDALWISRSIIADSGWTCEMAIPWKTLRYPKPKNNDTVAWGFNLLRIGRNVNERSSFPGYPRSFSTYRIAYAASLTGLQPPPPGINIQLKPYALVEYKKNTFTKDEYAYKYGGEVKWSVTPHSTLDLTINTDFAQADADRQVNNLTRFSVLFPERRQFFLENSGIFNAGDAYTYKPFVSRSVGLDNEGNPIPLQFGVRYTDNNVRYNAGTLFARQLGNATTAISNMSLVRFNYNIYKQNSIGLMVTNKFDEKLDTLKFNSNTTLHLTSFFRFNDKFSHNLILSKSVNSGQTGHQGEAFFSNFNYSSNTKGATFTAAYVSQAFDPRMGFLGRNDFVKSYFYFYLIKRKKKWFGNKIRSYEPGIELDTYVNPSDFKYQEIYNGLYPVILFWNNGSEFRLGLNNYWQNLTVPFAPLGIIVASGKYQYSRVSALYKTNQSAKLAASAKIESGKYYDGYNTNAKITLRYAPIPYIVLNAEYDGNYFKKLGIEKETKIVHLFIPNIRLALNPRLQLNIFQQYNTLKQVSRWNARFSWEYKPLSYIYLVYNNMTFPMHDKGIHYVENQAIFKISYLKQF